MPDATGRFFSSRIATGVAATARKAARSASRALSTRLVSSVGHAGSIGAGDRECVPIGWLQRYPVAEAREDDEALEE